MNLNVLHTADWHLGQRFQSFDRIEEHQLALDWLVTILDEKKIDLLIVAGDIFDTTTPPNYATSMYYDFLVKAKNTYCKNIIITGGNHDSPAMLNAPKGILQSLNIHVIGNVTEDPKEQIIPIYKEDQLHAVVAGVPFLRDRDLRKSIEGETSMEIVERVKLGIANHYLLMAELVEEYKDLSIPILTTGHLFAAGAKTIEAEPQNNIYIGNLDNITADKFPAVFDYVALGHIHRPQKIGGKENIRYSGSLIPMSFSEASDHKIVNVITFEEKKIKQIEALPVPKSRSLLRFKGNIEEIKSQLLDVTKEELIPWIELNIKEESSSVSLQHEIREFSKDLPLEIVRIRAELPKGSIDDTTPTGLTLEDLSIEEVFLKKCVAEHLPEEKTKDLLTTFRELCTVVMEEKGE